MARAVIILYLAGLLTGCSSETIYSSLQATQRNQCMAYQSDERERCLAAVDTSYETYEQQR